MIKSVLFFLLKHKFENKNVKYYKTCIYYTLQDYLFIILYSRNKLSIIKFNQI